MDTVSAWRIVIMTGEAGGGGAGGKRVSRKGVGSFPANSEEIPRQCAAMARIVRMQSCLITKIMLSKRKVHPYPIESVGVIQRIERVTSERKVIDARDPQ